MGQNSTMRLANEEKTDIKSEICWVENKHLCLKIVSTFWCHQKVDKAFSPFKHSWLPYAGTKSVYLVQGLWLSNLCSHLESYRRQSVYFMTSHRLSTFWWHLSTLWWHSVFLMMSPWFVYLVTSSVYLVNGFPYYPVSGVSFMEIESRTDREE